MDYRYSFQLRTLNPLNAREPVRARIARVKNERHVSFVEASCRRLKMPPLPASIKLIRNAAGPMDDDAIPAALKSVRDGIADFYKVDDGDPRYRWSYGQAYASVQSVTVEIEPLPA